MMNFPTGAADATHRAAAALHAIADGILAGIVLVPHSVEVWHHDHDPGSAARLLMLAHDHDEKIQIFKTHAGVKVKPFPDVDLTIHYTGNDLSESARAAYDYHNRVCRAPAGAQYWMAAKDPTIQP